MKVVHINYSDISGGAARAAYRLHQSLMQIGINSSMIVRDKISTDNNVYEINPTNSDNEINKHCLSAIQLFLIDENRTPISNTLFSLSYPGIELSKLSIIAEADIINLHWIANFQSISTIKNLLQLNKPIIWTIHDMLPFTGGCHYSSTCEKYQTKCLECPQINSNLFQIPAKILQDKQEVFSKGNIIIISPSQWLANCARQSLVFRDQRIEIIPNSIEIDVFYPILKNQAKQLLGLPIDSQVILLGASSSKEKRKGFEYLFKSLEILSETLTTSLNLIVLCFGEADEQLTSLHIPTKWLGTINSDHKLREIYSAADVFILPSLEDNLPNTMLESMACGTPVIGFDIGGIPDLVTNNITGILVPSRNIQKLAKIISECLANTEYLKQMSQNCRNLIKENYSLPVQGKRYEKIYREILTSSRYQSQNSMKEININLVDNSTYINTQIGNSFQSIYSQMAIDVLYKQITNERLQYKEILEGVENSFFWKLRNQWFILKNFFQEYFDR